MALFFNFMPHIHQIIYISTRCCAFSFHFFTGLDISLNGYAKLHSITQFSA